MAIVNIKEAAASNQSTRFFVREWFMRTFSIRLLKKLKTVNTSQYWILKAKIVNKFIYFKIPIITLFILYDKKFHHFITLSRIYFLC